MKSFYAILAAVGLVGAIAVGYAVGSGTVGTAVSVPMDLPGLDDPEALVAAARGVTRGTEEAPITIVEFGDFQCPVCAGFGLEVEPRVFQTLVETGRARFVFYDSPLVSIHANAFIGARAARCAEEQGRFWEYHDALFRQQSEWTPLQEPVEALEGLARSTGLDSDAFQACLRSDRHADLVTANLRLAQRLGVHGTPTVVVNVPGQKPRQVQRLDFESIMATVDEMTRADTTGAGG